MFVMDQLVLDYQSQVDKCFEKDRDRDQLYEWLRLYKENLLTVGELVSHLRKLIQHPDQLPIFDNSRCLIPHEDQEDYDAAIPNYYPDRFRRVLISATEKRVGFSVRGGIEYNSGVYVVDVEPASAAERCGIAVGDEILRVNGYSVESCTHREAVGLINKYKSMLSLKVRHIGMIPVPSGSNEGGWMFKWIFVDEIGSNNESNVEDFSSLTPKRGRISSQQGERTIFINWAGYHGLGCNIVDKKTGIFVSNVKPNTPAQAAGLMEDDEILEVNGVNFRKSTSNEIVFALKSSKQLRMVLRSTSVNQGRRGSRECTTLLEDKAELRKDPTEIEERIEKLFEAKLTKGCDANMREMQKNAYLPLPVNHPKAGNSGASVVEEEGFPSSSSAFSSLMKDIDKAAAEDPDDDNEDKPNKNTDPFDNEKALPAKDESVVYAKVYKPPPVPTTSAPKATKMTIVENDDEGNVLIQEHKINQGSKTAQIETRSSTSSTTEERENRRHKLETELKERLKLERHKRIAREKAVRLDRLRQELKETEREEARLQKLLEYEENLEVQHHTVGSHDYTTPDNILDKVQPYEFKLTTPSDMRQRNEKTSPIPQSPEKDLSRNMNHFEASLRRKHGTKLKIAEIRKNNSGDIRFRSIVEKGGIRKTIISSLHGELKLQGVLDVGDLVIALDGVEFSESQSSVDSVMQSFLRGKTQTTTMAVAPSVAPRINTTNEITYF